MAAISPDASAELEAMRKDDGSWHPCRISLSDDGSGIIVRYESYDEEYIISSREDALEHLRFRSVPLREGDCLHIEEGHCVLAMHKARSRTLFFDAVIEKPYRVKHSKRVYCRCNFEIKWLNPELKGETMTVPSSSIMKLSKKCITSDSVLGAYLNSCILTNRLEDNPPLRSLWEENDPDIDIYGLVQKIEETCLLGAKGGNPSRDAHNQNVRRSTRSRNKQEVEVKQKFQDDKLQSESKSFLSPLAYRAALASFMHEREWKDNGDFSFNNLKEKIQEKFSEVGSILLKSDASSHVDDWCPVQNADIDSPVEARKLSVSPASNQTNSRNKSQPKSPPVLLTMLGLSASSSASSKLPGTKQVSSTTMEHMVHLVADEKLNGHAATARKTRSALQKEILKSTAEVKQVLSNERNNHQISTRLTRSAKSKEVNSTNSVLSLGKNDLIHTTEGPKDEASEGGICSTDLMEHIRNSEQDEKPNENTLTSRKTRSAIHRQVLDSVADESSNHQMATGLTHSARENEVDSSRIIIGLRKSKSAEASQCEEMEAEMCASSTIEHARNSLTGGKQEGCAITPRMTRSAAQGGTADSIAADSTAEVVKVSLDDKQHAPVNTTRLTRSARMKALDNSNGNQELDNIQLAGGLNCHVLKGEPKSPSIMQHLKNQVTNGKLNDHATASRMTRSTMRRELGDVLKSTPEACQGHSDADKNGPMKTSWLTCSGMKESTVVCTKQALGNRKLADSQDESVDYLGSPERSESKKKMSLPINSDTGSMSSTKKRARTTDAGPNAKDDRGKISQNESTPAANREVISSDKSELRFSPRLRFLSQTSLH